MDDVSRLIYRTPAHEWVERLPLGNGALGAMLDGDLPTTRILLNEETAWSGSPSSERSGGVVSAERAAGLLSAAREAVGGDDPGAAAAALAPLQVPYSQAYLPLGELRLTRRGTSDAPGYRRALDLATGIHHVGLGGFDEHTFVSYTRGVLVHRIRGGGEAAWHLDSAHHVLARASGSDGAELQLRLPSDVAPTHEPQAVPVTWSDAPGDALEAAVVVGVRRDEGEILLVLAAETTFTDVGRPPEGSAADAAERARERVDAALEAGWSELVAEHTTEFAMRMSRCAVDLGSVPLSESGEELPTDIRLRRAQSAASGPLAEDPHLAQVLFDYGRYLLLSSSRPGGLPPTLQGIWNDTMQPPWSSNYTLNINMQMNHWAAHPTGLDESAEPLWDFISALAIAGTETAARLYGARGWVAHHNSDAWLLSSPVGAGHGDARWTAWPMAGPWLVLHIADAMGFGAIDSARLRRLWPAMHGVAMFLLDWVRPDGAGGWSSAPATSPENAFVMADGSIGAIDATTTMDLALAREALHAVAQVADRLGEGDDPVAVAALALARSLPGSPAVDGGLLREWARPRAEEDAHHRHVSHLVGLFPGTQPWDLPTRDAAAASLTRRGDESSGWSLIWKSVLWARLGRGDRAEDLLRLLFRDAAQVTGPWAGGLYPNLFAAHPPFQIDANLGYPAALAEMLLQSHDDLRLLPALPPSLAAGSARGLIARPGVIVDLTWRDRALVTASLRTRDERTRSVRVRSGASVLDVVLDAGSTVVLTASDFRAGARRSVGGGEF
ncbi:glycoside hydrolase N-terminal domain-containing protein [Microbacterium sp. HA-8]|uniref:glycosyl hydrolase family 95 catalytic domain-containing protein n=1 Tax=Microbacterium sp. HA-8 TaxID=3234200 RepID=UPI0038F742D6